MKASPFLEHLSAELQKRFGETFAIKDVSPEFGGSINESFRLGTTQGHFFLKRNNAQNYPEMFRHEAAGLNLLKTLTSFKVPEVILWGETGDHAFIIIEYLTKENNSLAFWKTFGHNLANMHKQTHDGFGLKHSNYIGSLHQSNTFKQSWADFFVSERLVPMVSMAHQAGKLDVDTVKKFEKLCFKMNDMFPAETPALLHGDLWSGNYMCTRGDTPCIFDPAVYYGHREMDLAMMQLFGGFHADTYKAYQEIYPLESGWKQRVDLCNLYPLLVHVNLFGGNYVKQVKQLVSQYT
ncbi:MAG TPA: fructosamine kinase family protein [Flavobacteriales bacterium]|nr:fructosamine kinase family protein [Flavobacteriales bacterium]